MTASYELLTGVGQLYIAPVGETFPTLDEDPAGNWEFLGNTRDGVKVSFGESADELRVDQETGPIAMVRSEESCVITTTLAEGTLENLAEIFANTVTTTAPGAGAVGFRSLGLYRGVGITEYAFLFRGKSPYGSAYIGQYQLPRAYLGGTVDIEHVKDGYAGYPVEFHALVDPDAASDDVKFGTLIAQDAAAS